MDTITITTAHARELARELRELQDAYYGADSNEAFGEAVDAIVKCGLDEFAHIAATLDALVSENEGLREALKAFIGLGVSEWGNDDPDVEQARALLATGAAHEREEAK